MEVQHLLQCLSFIFFVSLCVHNARAHSTFKVSQSGGLITLDSGSFTSCTVEGEGCHTYGTSSCEILNPPSNNIIIGSGIGRCNLSVESNHSHEIHKLVYSGRAVASRNQITCDPLESNCVTDPENCYCNIRGWKAHVISNSQTTKQFIITDQFESNAYLITNSAYELVAKSFLQVPRDGRHCFKLSITGSNMYAKVKLNHKKVAGVDFAHTTNPTYSFCSHLKSGFSYEIEVSIKGASNNSPWSWSFLWDQGSGQSLQACDALHLNPSIQDLCGNDECEATESEISCPVDCTKKFVECGDGVCSEDLGETVESCYLDCYGPDIDLSCTFTSPQPNIQQGLFTEDDTFGSLIDGIATYPIPGVDHMAHGVNIFTAEEEQAIFKFTYCPTEKARVLQDNYRANKYLLPEQVDADAYPYCTFSTDSETFSSTSELSESMQKEASLGASVSAHYDSVHVSGAFSGSKSSTMAKKMSAKRSGRIIRTQAKCLTSRISMRHHSLHSGFIHDLDVALEKDKNGDSFEEGGFLSLLVKYGSHYYVSAEMGGKLTMMVATHAIEQASSSNSDLQKQGTASFSASVSGFGMKAAAAGKYSESQGQSSDDQERFHQNSATSTIITEGGEPGAFGPVDEDSSAPSTWGSWAGGVDLLPVPVNFQLERISKLLVNTKYSGAWKAAETTYFAAKGVVSIEAQRATTTYKIDTYYNPGSNKINSYRDFSLTCLVQLEHEETGKPTVKTGPQLVTLSRYSTWPDTTAHVASQTFFDSPRIGTVTRIRILDPDDLYSKYKDFFTNLHFEVLDFVGRTEMRAAGSPSIDRSDNSIMYTTSKWPAMDKKIVAQMETTRYYVHGFCGVTIGNTGFIAFSLDDPAIEYSLSNYIPAGVRFVGGCDSAYNCGYNHRNSYGTQTAIRKVISFPILRSENLETMRVDMYSDDEFEFPDSSPFNATVFCSHETLVDMNIRFKGKTYTIVARPGDSGIYDATVVTFHHIYE